MTDSAQARPHGEPHDERMDSPPAGPADTAGSSAAAHQAQWLAELRQALGRLEQLKPLAEAAVRSTAQALASLEANAKGRSISSITLALRLQRSYARVAKRATKDVDKVIETARHLEEMMRSAPWPAEDWPDGVSAIISHADVTHEEATKAAAEARQQAEAIEFLCIERENVSRQHLYDYRVSVFNKFRAWLSRVIGKGAKVTFAIMSVMLIVVSLSELGERTRALNVLNDQIGEIQAKIANSARNGMPTQVQNQDGVSPEVAAIFSPSYEQTRITTLHDDMDLLLNRRDEYRLIQYFGNPNPRERPRMRLFRELPDNDSLKQYSAALYVFEGFSDEMLLFILGISGCALGAFVANLRNRNTSSAQDVLLGSVTGLFVMLSIKGGNAFFIEGQTSFFQRLDPYSITLLAVIVGLFTERVYKLLSEILFKFEQNVGQALSGTAPRRRPAQQGAAPDGSAKQP
jgi:hypothetical protein